MIIFDVFRNGNLMCRAGSSNGVILAALTWVSEGRYHDGKRRPEQLSLDVRWEQANAVHEALRVGDEIRIVIEEVDDADALEAAVAKKSGTDAA